MVLQIQRRQDLQEGRVTRHGKCIKLFRRVRLPVIGARVSDENVDEFTESRPLRTQHAV